jgi:hypothetical protein
VCSKNRTDDGRKRMNYRDEEEFNYIKRVEVYGDHANLSTREILNRKFLVYIRKSIFCAQICETPCSYSNSFASQVCGLKYEFVPHSKLSAMGIVLKRRDNAPITKVVYGGVLDFC